MRFCAASIRRRAEMTLVATMMMLVFFVCNSTGTLTDITSMDESDFEEMRVKELRRLLSERGLECRGCAEKDEYIEMLKKIQTREANADLLKDVLSDMGSPSAQQAADESAVLAAERDAKEAHRRAKEAQAAADEAASRAAEADARLAEARAQLQDEGSASTTTKDKQRTGAKKGSGKLKRNRGTGSGSGGSDDPMSMANLHKMMDRVGGKAGLDAMLASMGGPKGFAKMVQSMGGAKKAAQMMKNMGMGSMLDRIGGAKGLEMMLGMLSRMDSMPDLPGYDGGMAKDEL